jgi:hypothetical protein
VEGNRVNENAPYILQLLRLGMLLQHPDELEQTIARFFGDPQLRDIVTELQERRQAVATKKRLRNGPELLSSFLEACGCVQGIKSVEDARDAIRERVDVDGEYSQALEHLQKVAKVSVDLCGATSEAKRKFTDLVKNGAGSL